MTTPVGWVSGHYTAEELQRGTVNKIDTGATLAAGGLYPSARIRVSVAGNFRLYLRDNPTVKYDVYLDAGEHQLHAVKATDVADAALADLALSFEYVR